MGRFQSLCESCGRQFHWNQFWSLNLLCKLMGLKILDSKTLHVKPSFWASNQRLGLNIQANILRFAISHLRYEEGFRYGDFSHWTWIMNLKIGLNLSGTIRILIEKCPGVPARFHIAIASPYLLHWSLLQKCAAWLSVILIELHWCALEVGKQGNQWLLYLRMHFTASLGEDFIDLVIHNPCPNLTIMHMRGGD